MSFWDYRRQERIPLRPKPPVQACRSVHAQAQCSLPSSQQRRTPRCRHSRSRTGIHRWSTLEIVPVVRQEGALVGSGRTRSGLLRPNDVLSIFEDDALLLPTHPHRRPPLRARERCEFNLHIQSPLLVERCSLGLPRTISMCMSVSRPLDRNGLRTHIAHAIFVFSVSIYEDPFAWLIRPVLRTELQFSGIAGDEMAHTVQIGRISEACLPFRDGCPGLVARSSSSSLA